MACRIPVVGPVWSKEHNRRQHTVSEQTPFTYSRCSVDARNQFRARAIAIVIFQQELPRFLVQGRFRIWIDQQALDRNEYMTNPIG